MAAVRCGIDIADWNLVPFVRGLRSAACARPRAMARGDQVKIPGGRSIAFEGARGRSLKHARPAMA